MDSNLAKIIGDAVRVARAQRGLTQQEAAEAVGVSSEFYARIERGLTLPSVPTLLRLVEALRVSADVLLGQEDAGDRSAAPDAAKDPPELRRLVRRARRLKARDLRLLNLFAAALAR